MNFSSVDGVQDWGKTPRHFHFRHSYMPLLPGWLQEVKAYTVSHTDTMSVSVWECWLFYSVKHSAHPAKGHFTLQFWFVTEQNLVKQVSLHWFHTQGPTEETTVRMYIENREMLSFILRELVNFGISSATLFGIMSSYFKPTDTLLS